MEKKNFEGLAGLDVCHMQMYWIKPDWYLGFRDILTLSQKTASLFSYSEVFKATPGTKGEERKLAHFVLCFSDEKNDMFFSLQSFHV